MKEKTIKEYIYFRESAFQSMVADISTFVFLAVLFVFNHFVLSDSKVAGVAFFIVFILFCIGKTAGKGKHWTDKKALIKYLNETL